MTNHNRDDVDDLLSDLGGALELRKLINDVEPSPEFEARVRQRVATETAPGTRWCRWWWMGAAAVAAATIVVMIAMPRSGAMDEVAPVQTARMQPAALKPQKPVETSAPAERAVEAPVRAATKQTPAPAVRATRTRSLLDAPVIVPPGEAEAVARFVEAMWSTQIEPPRFEENITPLVVEPLPTPTPIVIAAVSIEPIEEGF